MITPRLGETREGFNAQARLVRHHIDDRRDNQIVEVLRGAMSKQDWSTVEATLNVVAATLRPVTS